MSRWKEIWDSRVERLDLIDTSDTQSVFAELKRIDGFDLEGGLPISSLLEQYENMKKELDVHGGQHSRWDAVQAPIYICWRKTVSK